MDNMIQEIAFIMALRKVRNSCREFMTNDQRYIGILRQLIWYVTVLRPRTLQETMNAFLKFNTEGEAIGYGLISSDGKKEWITGGLIPEYRSLGKGKELFLTLIQLCKKTPYLEVLKTNKPAIKLYKSIGFKEVKDNGNILIMKYAK